MFSLRNGKKNNFELSSIPLLIWSPIYVLIKFASFGKYDINFNHSYFLIETVTMIIWRYTMVHTLTIRSWANFADHHFCLSLLLVDF